MDGQCVSLLPGVCEVLAGGGRVLPDDSSLEKLLDWFTGFTKAGEYGSRRHQLSAFMVLLFPENREVMGKSIMVCTHRCTHTNLPLVWVVKDPWSEETRPAVIISA